MLESIWRTSARSVSATASGATAVSAVLTGGDAGRAAGGDAGRQPLSAINAIAARRRAMGIRQDISAARLSQHRRKPDADKHRSPRCTADLNLYVGSAVKFVSPAPRHPFPVNPLNRLTLALIVVCFRTLSAQNDPATNHAGTTRPTPVVSAAALTGSIQLDGKLDEPAWASAAPVTSFTQIDPVEGAPASEKTEVRVLVGPDALYVGAKLYESNPANIRRRLSRRDEPVDGDVFAVTLDSRHDHLTGYYFRVTAGGAMRDAVAGGPNGLDLSWDAVWDAAVFTDASGWSTEIRIPFSQLPYNRGDRVWGIQFERYSWNKQEQDFFAFTPKKEVGGVAKYGHLVGLGELPAPSRAELTPYVSTRAEYLRVPAGNPFRDGKDYFASTGADLKYRLTSSMTVSATVNPDFGQVEVDPAVVNLTAFETFFPEKRPFFVEGSELFNFGTDGTNSVFYSRRIGRQPSLAPPYAERDVPDATRILGATKLTGRTAGGWAMGVLDAVTERETARYRTPE